MNHKMTRQEICNQLQREESPQSGMIFDRIVHRVTVLFSAILSDMLITLALIPAAAAERGCEGQIGGEYIPGILAAVLIVYLLWDKKIR